MNLVTCLLKIKFRAKIEEVETIEMDIRINSTVEQIHYGLFETMENIPFRKITNRDIINNSHVSSRTFYRYFKDKNELLEKVEDGLISDLIKLLKKDRKLLEKETKENKVISSEANSYYHTLTYCAKKRREILLLLSQNGDIGFLIKIKNLGRKELEKRFKLTNRQLTNQFYLDNAVDKNLNVVINWLIYYDNLSKNSISKLLCESYSEFF